MLNAKVGSSLARDARAAGREAAQKAAIAGAQVAFVYASCAYDLEALLAGAAEVLPETALIGCTSYTGVLTPEGFISGPNGYVGIMALADDAMTIGVAGAPKAGDARATGRKVAMAAKVAAGRSDAPAYCYMVAPPGEEESYLKGVEDVIGRAPVFGGSAADNAVEGRWKVLAGRNAFSDGLGLVFFYTDKTIGTFYGGDYATTAAAGIITKVDGKRRLVEIDGQPALEKYASWRGGDADNLQGLALLVDSICHPLGIKDRLGDLVAIRHPMIGNADHSMTLGNDLAVGTAVVLMDGTPDDLIRSTSRAIAKVDERTGSKPGAYLLVHCGGRRGGIGDRIDEAAAEIIKAADGVPFIGVFTFGEYGFEDWGANTCGGLMLSFAGIAR